MLKRDFIYFIGKYHGIAKLNKPSMEDNGLLLQQTKIWIATRRGNNAKI
jgi:hypothetical protein